LCAAGRLALRAVKTDAVPYDMQALADFRGLSAPSAGNFTWADDGTSYDGFAPIFVYNPDGIDLQILVCCEWRVRFDPTNPAYASHTFINIQQKVTGTNYKAMHLQWVLVFVM